MNALLILVYVKYCHWLIHTSNLNSIFSMYIYGMFIKYVPTWRFNWILNVLSYRRVSLGAFQIVIVYIFYEWLCACTFLLFDCNVQLISTVQLSVESSHKQFLLFMVDFCLSSFIHCFCTNWSAIVITVCFCVPLNIVSNSLSIVPISIKHHKNDPWIFLLTLLKLCLFGQNWPPLGISSLLFEKKSLNPVTK